MALACVKISFGIRIKDSLRAGHLLSSRNPVQLLEDNEISSPSGKLRRDCRSTRRTHFRPCRIILYGKLRAALPGGLDAPPQHSPRLICHNIPYRASECSRNIEMAPLCKVDVT